MKLLNLLNNLLDKFFSFFLYFSGKIAGKDEERLSRAAVALKIVKKQNKVDEKPNKSRNEVLDQMGKGDL